MIDLVIGVSTVLSASNAIGILIGLEEFPVVVRSRGLLRGLDLFCEVDVVLLR